MATDKIFSLITCVITLGGIAGWFIMHSPQYLLYGTIAYLLISLIQVILKICSISGFAIDAIAFAFGYLVGIFASTENWIFGCLFMIIYAFIINMMNAFTDR